MCVVLSTGATSWWRYASSAAVSGSLVILVLVSHKGLT
jgi:hypothetical protein